MSTEYYSYTRHSPLGLKGSVGIGAPLGVFPHAVGVRVSWETVWDSMYARRPDGLPTFATVTDSDNRFNITKNHYDIKQGGQKVPHHIADKRPSFKSKLLGFIASVMDSFIGQSNNLDDQVTP